MGAENPPRLRTNARIGAICGDVIENALPINALKNENPEALGTYAMVAILQSRDRRIAAVVTVEQHTNMLEKLETFDITHAINGRIAKKKVASLPQGNWVTRITPRPPTLPSVSV